MQQKLKELRKPKNILRHSAEELTEIRNEIASAEDRFNFTKAVESTGKFTAIYNFFAVIGKDGVYYPIAELHQDKELYIGEDSKEIKALIYTGPMLEYKGKNRTYKCKAGDGKMYARASFVKFTAITMNEKMSEIMNDAKVREEVRRRIKILNQKEDALFDETGEGFKYNSAEHLMLSRLNSLNKEIGSFPKTEGAYLRANTVSVHAEKMNDPRYGSEL